MFECIKKRLKRIFPHQAFFIEKIIELLIKLWKVLMR